MRVCYEQGNHVCFKNNLDNHIGDLNCFFYLKKNFSKTLHFLKQNICVLFAYS